MNIVKIILLLAGLLALGFVGYLLIGFFFSLLWYVFVIGAVAAIGYGGYKLFKKTEEPATPQIENKQPIGISEMQNTDRALEEYKRKYLPK